MKNSTHFSVKFVLFFAKFALFWEEIFLLGCFQQTGCILLKVVLCSLFDFATSVMHFFLLRFCVVFLYIYIFFLSKKNDSTRRFRHDVIFVPF